MSNRLLGAALALLGALSTIAPAAADAPRPAPPCTAPALPEPVATRFSELGGVERFGCAVATAGPVYTFRHGQIEAIPLYGTNATYAAVVDRERVVHLYVSGADSKYDYDRWIVRLTFEGSLVNQVTYTSGEGDVGGTYASNILVHPGDRRGTFEIAMESCYHNVMSGSVCMPWNSLQMDL